MVSFSPLQMYYFMWLTTRLNFIMNMDLIEKTLATADPNMLIAAATVLLATLIYGKYFNQARTLKRGGYFLLAIKSLCNFFATRTRTNLIFIHDPLKIT